MSTLSEALRTNYSIAVSQAARQGHIYTIKSGKESYTLRLVQTDTATLERVHSIKSALYEKGFTEMDNYILTNDGLPYAYIDDRLYVLSKGIRGNAIDFSSEAMTLDFIRLIAKLHTFSLDGEMPAGGESITEAYARQIKTLRQLKLRASAYSKGKYSDTDILFIRSYPEMIELAESCFEEIAAIDYTPSEGEFCHNRLKEENILFSCSGVYLSGWEFITRRAYLCDLSDFILRYLKKSAAPIALDTLIEGYHKIRPLSDTEVRLLKTMLLFPSKYIASFESYYSKNRVWTPASIVKKTHEAIVRSASIDRYVLNSEVGINENKETN